MRAIGHRRGLLSVIMLCVVGLMLISVATIVATTNVLRRDIVKNAREQIDASMRVAWLLIHERGTDITLVEGRLKVGDTWLDGNVELVETFQHLVGGEMTVFRADGPSTTPNLEIIPQQVRDMVLRDGLPFRGIVAIAGKPYFAAYDPIKTAYGTVVGMLFVGFDEGRFMTGLSQVRNIFLDATLVGWGIIGVAFALLANSLGWKIRQREASLLQANRQLDIALDNINQGLCFIDSDQRLILANRRYGEIYSLPPQALLPGTSFERIAALRREAGSGPRNQAEHDQNIVEHMARERHEGDITIELSDGRAIAVHYRHLSDGAWIATHEDVTGRRTDAAHRKCLAQHDTLTGLPNRALFFERLEQALRLREPDDSFAVFCLDLDYFKQINATLGHPGGDRLLQRVAERLKTYLGEADTIARLSGDEFAVIAASPNEEATKRASKLLAAFAEPFDVGGHEVGIGASLGIALAPRDGCDAARLLQHADMALQRAKAEGRTNFCLFQPEMDEALQLRYVMQQSLRAALDHQQFEIFYQPMLEIATGTVIGFEALLRWRHPEFGMISPADFIPLAEDSRLILPIGAWVLRQACQEAASWAAPLHVAVNVSPVQFRGGDLVADVANALATSGLHPARLELEITESSLLQNNDATIAILTALKALGVRIALDDFGTGYASLGYLRHFRFDTLKIDQSFIRGLADHPDCETIVRAIAGLGQNLGMRVLAEGVETSSQLDSLRQAGCHSVQGYLFAHPRPAQDIPELLAGKFAA